MGVSWSEASWAKVRSYVKNKNNSKARCLWLMPIILATPEPETRRISVWSQLRQIVHGTLSLKYPTQKRAGGVTHVAELLPSMCKALSSNPSTAKNKTTPPNKNKILEDLSLRSGSPPFLRQDLEKLPRLAWNLWSSCLSFQCSRDYRCIWPCPSPKKHFKENSHN
jgi:hypothetical protein